MGSTYCSDAVVIGAGPAGLGTALGLAHEGLDVVVLDKQSRIGSVRRGETIRFDSEMDALLGFGFFEKQAVKQVRKRIYFSHTGARYVGRTISNPNNIINWPDFIEAIAGKVTEAGARIWPSSIVSGFLVQDRRVLGVKAMVNGHVEEDIKAKAVFSCGGCEDPASSILGMDRSNVDFPVCKTLVRGYAGPTDRLEYHFHIKGGSLAVGTIFPRSGDEAEIILMSFPGKRKSSRITFKDFRSCHPLFEERMKGTVPFYTLNSCVPMGGMIFPMCPRPGLVMAGDALGHVQARGGSGIRTSFMIGYMAGRTGGEAIAAGEWTDETSRIFDQKMEKTSQIRSLRLHNHIYSGLRSRIFGRISSPEEMDRKWPYLRMALR